MELEGSGEGMEKEVSEWHTCLGYFNIRSVEELSRSIVEEACERNPERSGIYWHAYWFLKDRPSVELIKREEKLAAFEATVGNLSENVRSPQYFSNYKVGEWGRPKDFRDTVGYARMNDPEFARSEAFNSGQTPWFGNNSRIRKGG